MNLFRRRGVGVALTWVFSFVFWFRMKRLGLWERVRERGGGLLCIC